MKAKIVEERNTRLEGRYEVVRSMTYNEPLVGAAVDTDRERSRKLNKSPATDTWKFFVFLYEILFIH